MSKDEENILNEGQDLVLNDEWDEGDWDEEDDEEGEGLSGGVGR